MAKKSIKVVIAGRNYPLSINENEEELVMNAVADINNSIQRLQENYAVKDMQDLLAMTALQLSTKVHTNKKVETSSSTPQLEKSEVLTALEKLSTSMDA